MVDVPITVPETATVYELINLFNDQKMHRRLHRVAVSSHGKIYNIITQWDLIVFANKHKPIIPHVISNSYQHFLTT
jgi:CBS-domain-containing membrane protein